MEETGRQDPDRRHDGPVRGHAEPAAALLRDAAARELPARVHRRAVDHRECAPMMTARAAFAAPAAPAAPPPPATRRRARAPRPTRACGSRRRCRAALAPAGGRRVRRLPPGDRELPWRVTPTSATRPPPARRAARRAACAGCRRRRGGAPAAPAPPPPRAQRRRDRAPAMRCFRNSLKQALVLQCGSERRAVAAGRPVRRHGGDPPQQRRATRTRAGAARRRARRRRGVAAARRRRRCTSPCA